MARSGADGRAYQRTAAMPRCRLGFSGGADHSLVLGTKHASVPPDGGSVSGSAYGGEMRTVDHGEGTNSEHVRSCQGAWPGNLGDPAALAKQYLFALMKSG